MAFSISKYTDPGVNIKEVIEPGSVSVTSERTLALVGLAPRSRRATDEAVVRGKIYEEALTVATSSPHIATLVNASNRDRSACVLYMNSNELSLADWSLLSAALVGTEWGGATVDVSNATGTQYFTFSADGKRAVTVDFQAGQVAGVIAAAATATPTEVCNWINYELSNTAGSFYSIYGDAYSAVATHATGTANEILTLTSPLSTGASDLKVFLSTVVAGDAASTISNAAWVPTAGAGIQADTIMEIATSAYSSAAAYTLDYVTIDLLVDPLDKASTTDPLLQLVIAGSYPGGSDYTLDYDYRQSTNDIEWSSTSWANASLTSLDFVASPPTITVGVNDILLLSLNGRTNISITLTAGAPTTTTQVALDINTALSSIATAYGPEFGHVAQVVGNTVVLTMPEAFPAYVTDTGASSEITVLATSTAYAAIFGTASIPRVLTGTGRRPEFGTSYYSTYQYTRPASDYTKAHRVYDPDQLYVYTTPLTLQNYTGNDLCIGGEIVFENQASSMYLVQIDDSFIPGTPTETELKAALDVCAEYKNITEVVVLGTASNLAVPRNVMLHVADQSSMLEKHYRRAWIGMARDTDPGDPDTPDTFIHTSTMVLQPGAKSPGRGRLFLIAPANATRTIRLENGQESDVDVDGSYIAAAVASVYTALPSVSSVLLNKFVRGFKEEGFGIYLRGERHAMAEAGVTVVTLDDSTFEMLDPLSTEAGGSNMVQFAEPSASAQKDIVTNTVDAVLKANVVGVVPDDLADYITDVKKWIMLAILANIENGNIAPYRNADKSVRDIDATTDIQVYQSSSDPRTFYFKYWYNLKYPAKRFFGEYSVDNPFFSPV